jgi:hypothetical protein
MAKAAPCFCSDPVTIALDYNAAANKWLELQYVSAGNQLSLYWIIMLQLTNGLGFSIFLQ